MSSKISGPKSKVEKSFDNYYSLNPRACSETHCLFQPDSGCPVAWSWQFPFLLPSLCSCCLLDAERRRRVEGETGVQRLSCTAPSTACSPGSGRLKLDQAAQVIARCRWFAFPTARTLLVSLRSREEPASLRSRHSVPCAL